MLRKSAGLSTSTSYTRDHSVASNVHPDRSDFVQASSSIPDTSFDHPRWSQFRWGLATPIHPSVSVRAAAEARVARQRKGGRS